MEWIKEDKRRKRGNMQAKEFWDWRLAKSYKEDGWQVSENIPGMLNVNLLISGVFGYLKYIFILTCWGDFVADASSIVSCVFIG